MAAAVTLRACGLARRAQQEQQQCSWVSGAEGAKQRKAGRNKRGFNGKRKDMGSAESRGKQEPQPMVLSPQILVEGEAPDPRLVRPVSPRARHSVLGSDGAASFGDKLAEGPPRPLVVPSDTLARATPDIMVAGDSDDGGDRYFPPALGKNKLIKSVSKTSVSGFAPHLMRENSQGQVSSARRGSIASVFSSMLRSGSVASLAISRRSRRSSSSTSPNAGRRRSIMSIMGSPRSGGEDDDEEDGSHGTEKGLAKTKGGFLSRSGVLGRGPAMRFFNKESEPASRRVSVIVGPPDLPAPPPVAQDVLSIPVLDKLAAMELEDPEDAAAVDVLISFVQQLLARVDEQAVLSEAQLAGPISSAKAGHVPTAELTGYLIPSSPSQWGGDAGGGGEAISPLRRQELTTKRSAADYASSYAALLPRGNTHGASSLLLPTGRTGSVRKTKPSFYVPGQGTIKHSASLNLDDIPGFTPNIVTEEDEDGDLAAADATPEATSAA